MSEQHDTASPQPDTSPEHILTTHNSSVDWAERNAFPKGLLNSLERVSLAFEKPVSRWVREGKFNPLYHTGTITVLLLFIILGTGVYLTMFYQFGFEASYQAVANIEANFIGRAVRALHRYASGAAMIFALLHGWRTFFQDRFRGPRWLAWTTGIGMAAIVWLIGITGYWLIWDERAAVLNQTLINLLSGSRLGIKFLVRYLVTENARTGWIFMVLVITVHLGLSAVVGLFYWWHIKRVSRAKWLPPNYGMIAVSTLLVLASIFIPVGMLAPIDPSRLPGEISVDLFYLFHLPGALNWPTLLFWGGVILIIGLAAALPWWLTRKKHPPIVVDAERCTGCTLCAADCPYKAIEMIERQDGRRYKFLADINPDLCVSCGICIGTCAPLAMTLGDRPAEPLWGETLARISEVDADPVKVVFTCERHTYQGARQILSLSDHGPHPKSESNPLALSQGERGVLVVPLTCIGMAHPDLATQALEAGASEVQFIGCPPEDCANREGNVWLQARLERERLPRLHQNFKKAPIYSDWLPPNDFVKALENPNQQRIATGYNLDYSQVKWQNFIPAILLLVLVFALQIWLSDWPYSPYAEDTALLEVALNHKAGYPIKGAANNLEPELVLSHPTRLIIQVDEEIQLDQSYPPQGRDSASIAFEQITLTPGEHQILVTIFDRPDQVKGEILIDEAFLFENRGILKLSFRDAQISGDPAAGRDLFFESSLGASASCHICHSLEAGVNKVGPSLAGIGNLAAERVPGMSAEAYLRESMIAPDAYIVEDYSAGLMLPDLDENLSEEQIEDLIAFLLTMK